MIIPIYEKALGTAVLRAFSTQLVSSFEVAWTPLDSFAFFTFGNIFDSAVFDDGFHLYFTAAGAVEVMGRGSRACVFRNLCHENSFGYGKQPPQEYRNQRKKSIHKNAAG